MKKILSVFLALVIILSIGTFSVSAVNEDVTELKLGESLELTFSANEVKTCIFTPKQSGNYKITVEGNSKAAVQIDVFNQASSEKLLDEGFVLSTDERSYLGVNIQQILASLDAQSEEFMYTNAKANHPIMIKLSDQSSEVKEAFKGGLNGLIDYFLPSTVTVTIESVDLKPIKPGHRPHVSHKDVFEFIPDHSGKYRFTSELSNGAMPNVTICDYTGCVATSEGFKTFSGESGLDFDVTAELKAGETYLVHCENNAMNEENEAIGTFSVEVEDLTEYAVGDIIEFGSYPQSLVTDEQLVEELNSQPLNWISYKYTCADRNYTYDITERDFMRYADVTYLGQKYRAVVFDEYRPMAVYCNNDPRESCQDANGYYINTVYFFKYEPLKWRVLDPKTGLVVTESLIDAQPFHDTIYYNTEEEIFYQDSGCEKYANDYETSFIRNWLNSQFLTDAFASDEISKLASVTLDNTSPDNEKFSGNPTTDKVFLLSYSDVTNADYGFVRSENRRATGTDYAECQGLYVYIGGQSSSHIYDGNSVWIQRTPGDGIGSAVGRVSYSGSASIDEGSQNSCNGIRPAVMLNLNGDTETCSIESVTYIQQEDTRKDFTVTVNGRKTMIQFIEPDGGTRTYDRYNKNVKITSYNANGEVVNAMARDLSYEVWKIHSNMSVGVEINVRGKENGRWDRAKYAFTIEEYNPIISMELSAVSGKKGAVPAKVIADEKTEKVMFKMPDGSSVTVAYSAVDVDGNRQFKGNAWMNEDGLNEIKVYIRRDNVWKLVGTLEYTVE